MKISTKGRYGLRAMLDLAKHSRGEYISLGSIAERQNISLNYLEHSFSSLKKAGLVLSVAGSNGGYKLRLPPEQIPIQQILAVLEGDLSIVDAVPPELESPLQQCVRDMVWDIINERVQSIVATTTLKDMMQT